MANHFPAAPSDMVLTTMRYFAQLPVPFITATSPLSFGEQVTTELAYSDPSISVAFSFTEGDTGTFDQDTVEAVLTQMITAVCTVLAGASGLSLAQVQAQVVITRSWNWASTKGPGYSGAAQDTMPYPQEAAA